MVIPDITEDLKNLNPTVYFRVYGKGADVNGIRDFIYNYFRENYITGKPLFVSNICSQVEQRFSSVKSIRYLGVDLFDASYQQFTYTEPKITNKDALMKFIPEQLNVSDVRIELDEDTI